MGTNGNNGFRQEYVERTLAEHDDRITELERYKLMTQGALAVVGFMLGSGFVTAAILFAI